MKLRWVTTAEWVAPLPGNMFAIGNAGWSAINGPIPFLGIVRLVGQVEFTEEEIRNGAPLLTIQLIDPAGTVRSSSETVIMLHGPGEATFELPIIGAFSFDLGYEFDQVGTHTIRIGHFEHAPHDLTFAVRDIGQ